MSNIDSFLNSQLKNIEDRLKPSVGNKFSSVTLEELIVHHYDNGYQYPLSYLNMIASYMLDKYWECSKRTCPLVALNAIEKLALNRQKNKIGHSNVQNFNNSMTEGVLVSVKMLRFLHTYYIKHLKRKFIGCFLTGSMSYGRFYNVKKTLFHQSDLDLLIVTEDGNFNVNDLLVDGWVVDTIDDKSRLKSFSANFNRLSEDILNYKIYNVEEDFVISINLCSLASFENIFVFDRGAKCNLHWSESIGGGINIQKDLAGRPFNLRYNETYSLNENILTVAAFSPDADKLELGLFNPIVAMLVPRFEILFGEQKIIDIVSLCIIKIGRLSLAFQKAGYIPRICNVHKRRNQFSPLFSRSMNNTFNTFCRKI